MGIHSLWSYLFHILHFSPQLSLAVGKCWGYCSFGKPIDLTAALMTQLSEWCLLVVALAIIVLIHCLVCNPLPRLSKHLLSKGMNTRGSTSVSTSYPPFLFLLILLLSTRVTFSLLFHIQNFHRRSGRSVTIKSKMTRTLTPAITEMSVSPVFTL